MNRGELGILNVGAGDTKLTFDKSNPVERERAAKIVTDMLRRGYAILVQVGDHNGEPTYCRARAFDPDTCEYVIAGGQDESIDIGAIGKASGLGDGVPLPAPKKRGRPRKIPAERTHAVAVARTAGG